MNAKHPCKLLALSLAFAGNLALALAHGGHDHDGHAAQPPAAIAQRMQLLALPLAGR